MTKQEKEQLNKKIRFHEKLGAAKFQKIVFIVEKYKFKLIKSCFPNFIKYYDKYCDYNLEKSLKYAKSDAEIEKLKRDTKFAKMAMRKELNQEKNRNYHMDDERPTEIYTYLLWNKAVHVSDLKRNLILTPIFIVGTIFGVPGAMFFLIIEAANMIINLECINIQDWNINKFKRSEEAIIRKEQKRTKHNIDSYEEVASIIDKKISEDDKLPSFAEIIDSITTQEQLEQMKSMLLNEFSKRQSKSVRGK